MKSADTPRRSSRGKIISLAIIAIGVATGIYVENRISIRPSTDDATIDADVVHVAAAVGGRIIELPVTENAKVSKGDLLFRIDPVPYRLAVEQAEADLGVAMGALDTRRRAIATEKSNAAIAAEQIKRAQTNLELATRTAERLRPLAGKAYVPTQQFDQAQTAQRDAATSLQQAREQEAAAFHTIGTEAAAAAAVQARQAALAIARRALDDTTVRAWHDGRVVGLTVLSGEMVV
ncbi:MAG: biotin/lipoyl-binding protein, partial [Methylocella sp.]